MHLSRLLTLLSWNAILCANALELLFHSLRIGLLLMFGNDPLQQNFCSLFSSIQSSAPSVTTNLEVMNDLNMEYLSILVYRLTIPLGLVLLHLGVSLLCSLFWKHKDHTTNNLLLLCWEYALLGVYLFSTVTCLAILFHRVSLLFIHTVSCQIWYQLWIDASNVVLYGWCLVFFSMLLMARHKQYHEDLLYWNTTRQHTFSFSFILQNSWALIACCIVFVFSYFKEVNEFMDSVICLTWLTVLIICIFQWNTTRDSHHHWFLSMGLNSAVLGILLPYSCILVSQGIMSLLLRGNVSMQMIIQRFINITCVAVQLCTTGASIRSKRVQ